MVTIIIKVKIRLFFTSNFKLVCNVVQFLEDQESSYSKYFKSYFLDFLLYNVITDRIKYIE